MKAVTVIELCTLGAGSILKLDADQAKTRSYGLKELAKGVYEATQPLQFKKGQEFGYDGPMDRVLEAKLEVGEDIALPAGVSARKPDKKKPGKG